MKKKKVEVKGHRGRGENKKLQLQRTLVVEQPATKAAVAVGPGAVICGVQGRHALGERLAHVDGGRCCFFVAVIARSDLF